VLQLKEWRIKLQRRLQLQRKPLRKRERKGLQSNVSILIVALLHGHSHTVCLSLDTKLQFIFTTPGPFGLKFDKSGKINHSAGQAAEIGLKKGDVIVEVGGVKADKATIVEKMKSLPRPGEIWVLRPGIFVRYHLRC
jgi:hypothetical protein